MFSYSYILYIYIIFSYSYTLKILIVIKFYDTVYHNIHDTEYNNNMCDLCMCGKTNITWEGISILKHNDNLGY